MKIKIKELEEKLGYKIKTNVQSIGLDIAERTGITIITTDNNYANLDWTFIEFDKSNIDNVYKEMYKEFSEIVTKEKGMDNIVVIEDTFLKRFPFIQPDVFKKLTRFGTLALACCFDNNIDYEFILAKSSRAKLKIKMIKGKPKESVANYLNNTFDIEVDDDDIADSICLSILGICEGMDYRSQVKIDKAKLPKKKKIKKSVKKVKVKKK